MNFSQVVTSELPYHLTVIYSRNQEELTAEGVEKNLMSYVPANLGRSVLRRGKRFERFVAVESIVFFGHEETIGDQAESEADEDFRRMSKSSG
jgi:hypothetical protein